MRVIEGNTFSVCSVCVTLHYITVELYSKNLCQTGRELMIIFFHHGTTPVKLLCLFSSVIISTHKPESFPLRRASRLSDLIASGPPPVHALSPFDVAALFVHQRQRSALSHSTICHLLNPSLWPGSSSSIVCI